MIAVYIHVQYAGVHQHVFVYVQVYAWMPNVYSHMQFNGCIVSYHTHLVHHNSLKRSMPGRQHGACMTNIV